MRGPGFWGRYRRVVPFVGCPDNDKFLFRVIVVSLGMFDDILFLRVCLCARPALVFYSFLSMESMMVTIK